MAALQDGDHYLLRKLCNEILPWMIVGRKARRQWFVRVATVHTYGGEVATAIAGLGIGAPLVALFQGKVANGQNAIDLLRQALPGFWFWIGIVALAVWLALRLVVRQQNVIDRALFARDCNKTMQKLYADLFDALVEPNPLPKIAPIQEALRRAVREAIEKSVWPLDPPQPQDRDVEPELGNQVAEIRAKYMPLWAAPPAGVI